MTAATARSFFTLLVFLWCALLPVAGAAQSGAALRVTVRDETEAALIHAVVAVVDAVGVEKQVLVDESGVAAFSDLLPGT